MALLARAPLNLLEEVLSPLQASREIEWLRRPETGLYMVQGRAGGTGERFNLGEVTVTRCTLRASSDADNAAPVGVAYVMGRSHRHAELAALADALLQGQEHCAALESSLLNPIRQHLALTQARHQARMQSTKVEFFTVARESGATDEEES